MVGRANDQVLPIGGPGPAYTPFEQGQLLFRLLNRDESFISVPVGLFDAIIGGIDALAKVFPNFEVYREEQVDDKLDLDRLITAFRLSLSVCLSVYNICTQLLPR